MTVIKNNSPKEIYKGPFTKNQLLPIPFPYADKTDVFVMIDSELASTEYEIVDVPSLENPEISPNSIKLKVDLPKAQKITVYRATPLDQQAAFPQNAKFSSKRIEDALDKICMQQQEQEEQLARCIIAPITLETFNGQLPDPAPNQALKWDEEGLELENYDIIGRQDAFEEKITNDFINQKTEIETTITQFQDETVADFNEFRAEIAENLDAVLNAAGKLDILEEQVQTATDAASQAAASATQADQASVDADQAADVAELAATQAGKALNDVQQYVTDIKQELGQYTGLPMFVPIWSDHTYNDASYLRADHFSWQPYDVYVTAYEILVDQYDNENSVVKEESGITYKLTPEGFRIADVSQHDAILELYLGGHRAWFYILDKENQRFKLPRENSNEHKYLYFYVGNYERPNTDIQLGILAEMANGVDIAEIIENINTAAADGVTAVNTATETGVTEIESVKSAGVTEIETLTTNGVNTINSTAEEANAVIQNIVENGVPFATTETAGIVRPDGETVTIVDGVISASAGCEYSVIEVYGDSTSGYRLWSDGYCEQWGTLQTVNNALSTVTLLKPYIDLNYNIAGSCLNPDTKLTNTQGVIYYLDTAAEGIYILHKTTSSFDACTQSPGYVTSMIANTAYWKASGYIS